MSKRQPARRILWLGPESGPSQEALFEQLRRLEPDSVWTKTGTVRKIGAERPALIHAFGRQALRAAVRAARGRECRVVYEPDPFDSSLRERLAWRLHRPDAVVRRVLDPDKAVVPSTGEPVVEIRLPVVALVPQTAAPVQHLAELYVGIVVDGLGCRDRRLLARALSWVPRGRGITCLLFGSGGDCRRMWRALKLVNPGDEWPVRFVERDRPHAEDWARCAVSVHTMCSTASGQLLADALAAGTAVVVHDSVSVPAVVDGDSGLYIPPFNPFDLCHSLQYLQAQPGLLRSMADRCRARALQHYSASAVAPMLLTAYRRLLGDESPADDAGGSRRIVRGGSSNSHGDSDTRTKTLRNPARESRLQRTRALNFQWRQP